MSSDLEEYQGIIDRLKPVLSQPDFESVFKALTHDVPKTKQFLIKMELNRLKKACNRYIDLRGHVDGDIREYEYGNKTHYMDDEAIRVFEKGLEIYGGYTMGVYDDVMNTDNNYRVRHQKEKQRQQEERERQAQNSQSSAQLLTGSSGDSAKQQNTATSADPHSDQHINNYGANRAEFSGYAVRAEERMNFSIPIEVVTKNHKPVSATTSDLSVGGCKVRLPLNVNLGLEAGDRFYINFKGLEQEFALGLKKSPEYEAVGVDIQDKYQYLRAKRIFDDSNQSFDDFLRNFINGNKRRYKVNLDNTELAVIVKGYEQYYLPRISSLPVFCTQNEAGQYVVHSVLTTENNKSQIMYWRDEEQNFVLSQIISNRRIQTLRQLERDNQDTLLYVFTHTAKGRVFFYSATQDELFASPQLRELFFGFGATKPTWRVFKMQLYDTHEDDAYTPLSLPESAGQDVRKLNKPPSARVMSHIKESRLIVDLLEIREPNLVAHYQANEFEMQQVNQLKKFGHPKLKNYPWVEIVAIEYINLRKETRFLYKTSVRIDKNPNISIEGATRDFSTKGIQVETVEPAQFVKGDVVLVTFPDLQKITKKYKLVRLPYEVVAVSKNQTILNMRIYEVGGKHLGRLFFQQLIQTNRAKLTAALESPKIPGLSDALRNMYAKAFCSLPFYIHRNRLRFFVKTIACGGRENSLHKLLALYKEADYDYNTYLLAKNNTITNVFGLALKSLKRQDPPKMWEIFVRLRRNQPTVEEAFIVEFGPRLAEMNAEPHFIQQALRSNELFFCYKVALSRTGRPDMEFISNELKYVSTYAIHRAKALEEELWDVCGVGDIADISDEVMHRFNFSPEVIQQHRTDKQTFFKQIEIRNHRLQQRSEAG